MYKHQRNDDKKKQDMNSVHTKNSYNTSDLSNIRKNSNPHKKENTTMNYVQTQPYGKTKHKYTYHTKQPKQPIKRQEQQNATKHQ